MNVAFNAIYAGPHGDTVTVDDPKKEAYVQCAYIRNILRLSYSLTGNDDGTYTVTGDGLESITFAGLTLESEVE